VFGAAGLGEHWECPVNGPSAFVTVPSRMLRASRPTKTAALRGGQVMQHRSRAPPHAPYLATKRSDRARSDLFRVTGTTSRSMCVLFDRTRIRITWLASPERAAKDAADARSSTEDKGDGQAVLT
jgi:hypothetical protein